MGQSKSIYFWCLHTKECTQTELGRVYPCWMEQSWLSQSFSIRRSSDGCKSSTLLAAESKAIEKGSSIAFRQGPSLQQKKARSHHQELARVVQLGKDIVSLSNFQIDPNSGHRPPLVKKWNSTTKGIRRKKMNKTPHNNHSHAPKMPTHSCNNHPYQHQHMSFSCKMQLMWQMISLNSIRSLQQVTRHNLFVYRLVALVILTCAGRPSSNERPLTPFVWSRPLKSVSIRCKSFSVSTATLLVYFE